MNRPLLSGKTILVVGGTSGLGRSAALALQASGANLAVTGPHAAALEEVRQELGNDVLLLAADARDPPTHQEIVSQTVRRFGRLDGLYHVAGGSGRVWGDGPLDRLTDEGWHQTMRLNLDTVMYSNRAALNQMLTQHTGGSILNVSSVLARYPASEHFATHAYAAAKAAIIGLTRSCAARYASENIRFNVLAPALVETPMSERACGNSEIREYVQHRQPLDAGRVGLPQDLDGAVCLLLSDQARYITGQTLYIDGGWSVC